MRDGHDRVRRKRTKRRKLNLDITGKERTRLMPENQERTF